MIVMQDTGHKNIIASIITPAPPPPTNGLSIGGHIVNMLQMMPLYLFGQITLKVYHKVNNNNDVLLSVGEMRAY